MKGKRRWLILAAVVWLGSAMVACQCSGPVSPPPAEKAEELPEELQERPQEEPPEEREEPEDEPLPPAEDVLDDLHEELRKAVLRPRLRLRCRPVPDDLPAVGIDLSSGDCHVLCLWGFPYNEAAHIEIFDPSGQSVAAHDETIERGQPDRGLKMIDVWLGGQPTGDWTVVVDSGGVRLSTLFHVPEPTDPKVSIALEAAGPFTIEETACGTTAYGRSDRIALFGAGFPAARTLPLGIYRWRGQFDTYHSYHLVYRQEVRTDGHGRFKISEVLRVWVPEGGGSYLATVLSDASASGGGAQIDFSVESDTGVPSEAVILELGVEGGVFADERVQRAVLAAFDRRELSDHFDSVPVTVLFSPSRIAVDASGEPRNPDLARELLAEAGYPDGVRATFLYPAGDGKLGAVAQDMIRDLEEVGIFADALTVSRADIDNYTVTAAMAGEPVLWLVRR